jgi:ATP-binding protein involved in chromosome partitioning
MFEKVQVQVLGLVENMAVHVCTRCGHAEHIFGEGGGQRMAEQYGVPLLGSLPLDVSVREFGDSGQPIVTDSTKPDTVHPYRNTARRLALELSGKPQVARPLSASLLS